MPSDDVIVAGLVICLGGALLVALIFAMNAPQTESSAAPETPDTQQRRREFRKSRVFYRALDGVDFEFSFEQAADGSFRIYILSNVEYRGRDSSCHATHRLRDGDRYYVCWSGTIWTEAEARQVAAQWADRTQTYRKTGKRF